MKTIAFAAFFLAALVSAGNFLAGHLAVREIPADILTFWRTFIAALVMLPLAAWKGADLWAHFRRDPARIVVLSLVGVVAPPLFIYLGLASSKLVDLSIGFSTIPLMTLLLSALLLGERMSRLQYFGVLAAFLGSLVLAVHGNPARLVSLDLHVPFLWVLACAFSRSLYLVLLKRWNMGNVRGEGFLLPLLIAPLVLFPGFLHHAVTDTHPFAYSGALWASVLYVGLGMGVLYQYLQTFGAHYLGASRFSLYTYLVPVLVTLESFLFLDAEFHAYQAVGGLLVLGGVFMVTRRVST
jgi:drug/metabolite transporter (DMT)-like permease